MIRRFIKNDKASMTLEAALIVPVFLVFIMFLVMMIRLAVAQTALDQSVSDTAELIATHAYPAKVAAKAAEGKIDDMIQEKSMGVVDLSKVKEILDKGLKRLGVDVGDNLNNLTASLLTPVVQDKFGDITGQGLFDKKDVKVVKAEGLTSLTSGSDAHIDLIATYQFDLFVPFIHKSVILKSRAYEKLWVGS